MNQKQIILYALFAFYRPYPKYERRTGDEIAKERAGMLRDCGTAQLTS